MSLREDRHPRLAGGAPESQIRRARTGGADAGREGFPSGECDFRFGDMLGDMLKDMLKDDLERLDYVAVE